MCLEEEEDIIIVRIRLPRQPAESAKSKEKYSPRRNIPQQAEHNTRLETALQCIKQLEWPSTRKNELQKSNLLLFLGQIIDEKDIHAQQRWNPHLCYKIKALYGDSAPAKKVSRAYPDLLSWN